MLVRSTRWGLSICWQEQHFCSGRILCVPPAFFGHRMQFVVLHVHWSSGRDAQVQPVEGGERQRVSRHRKESSSLPSVSTSRWAVSCLEVRPALLVPTWAGTRDLPYNAKTCTYVRDSCWRTSSTVAVTCQLWSFILTRLLGSSGSAKAHERGGCVFCESKRFCEPQDFDYQCPCDWHLKEHTRQALSFEANIKK